MTNWCRSSLKPLGFVISALLFLLPGHGFSESNIDAQAIKILKQSTDFIANQQRFSVDTRNTIEAVLESGQKIQFDHVATLSVERPNKLRAERQGDLVEQDFYYDGASLTLHNPQDNYYATVAAPGTLEEMMDFARDSLDIVAPGGDLIYTNAFDILMEDVVSGFVVGKSMIEGVRCDHLAFQGSTTDWQIWIQEGANPLPRKLVITSIDVLSAPQFSVVTRNWNLKPDFKPGTFVFSPPKDAQSIEFLTRSGSAQ